MRFSVAELRINFGKAFFQKVTADARVNFSIALSTVGGTLGLFTGFSIISALEIIYWIYKGIFKRR